MLIFPSFLQMTLDLKGEAIEQQLPFVQEGGGGFSAFVSSMLTALMAVAALSVLVFLLWGAFDWLNSGGEKGKIESARNKITGAIMGIVVLATVLVIFNFIQQILGIQVLQFTSSPTSSAPPAAAPLTPGRL